MLVSPWGSVLCPDESQLLLLPSELGSTSNVTWLIICPSEKTTDEDTTRDWVSAAVVVLDIIKRIYARRISLGRGGGRRRRRGRRGGRRGRQWPMEGVGEEQGRCRSLKEVRRCWSCDLPRAALRRRVRYLRRARRWVATGGDSYATGNGSRCIY